MAFRKLGQMNFGEYTCMNYAIRQGDTLYGISRDYNVPLPLILRLNPFMDIYNLQVGDEICIPVQQQAAEVGNVISYTVEEQDSLQSILDKFGIGLDDLLEYNGLNEVMLMPGTTIQVPSYDV